MPHLCWAVLILYPLSSLCVALPPYLLQKMLDLGVAQRRVDLLQWYALWYFVFVLLEYWIGFLSEYSLGFLGIRAMTFLRKDVFSHMLRICPPYFDHQPIGKIQTRVIGDIDALGEAFGSGSIGLIGDFFTTCIVLGMMFYFSPILTLYVVLGMPLLIALLNILQAYARQAFRKIRHQIGVLNGFLAEYIGGMQVVRMLGQEKRTAESLSVYNREYRDANRQAIFADAALYSLIEAWSTFMIGLLLWSVPTLQSWWGMQTTLSAGIVVAFIQYVRRLFVPLRDLASKYTLLQAALVAAERIFLFLKEPIESLVVLTKSEDNPVKTDMLIV
jgi:ATP-binding cassette subfamily B protein